MADYELVHEIKNSCPNNQMRDIFFQDVTCDDPEVWLRQRLAGKNYTLTIEPGVDGAVTIHATVDGMLEKFVFTPF